MKKIFSFIGIAVAAMAVLGCQKENITSDNQNNEKTISLVVNASADALTKAYIYPVQGGYMTSWQSGDCITVGEMCEGETDNAMYESDPLTEADIIDGKAAFKLEIEDKNLPESKFTYVAGNNYPFIFTNYWENADDESYNIWKQRFDYTGEYVEPHMVVEAFFRDMQSPTADTFDPEADLLVSKQVTVTGQPKESLELQFARLGTIVRITLDGLDNYKGMTVGHVAFRVGPSFSKSLNVIYDPILEKYTHSMNVIPSSDDLEDPVRPIIFDINPIDVSVKEDGTADIWLRTYSGELTDNFTIEFFVDDGEDGIMLKRNVDLAAEGKTIKFEEGKMTVFSVGSFGIADVEDVGDFTYKVNAARDGFSASWAAVEHATGYKCILKGGVTDENIVIPDVELAPVDNGDGTWSVAVESGLIPFLYRLQITPVPEEGHAQMSDYPSEFELLIGVPTYWMLAHDSFGSIDSEYIEGSDDEYMITLGPGKIRYKNLNRQYQSSWQALVSSGPWFMYTTAPLTEIVKIQLWSKDDSHLTFNVYACKSPNDKAVKLDGNVIEVSDIDVGKGQYHYKASHKLVEYVFPAGEVYQYFAIEGDQAQTVLTSQHSYIYYYL